jgi:hypothetical protein
MFGGVHDGAQKALCRIDASMRFFETFSLASSFANRLHSGQL